MTSNAPATTTETVPPQPLATRHGRPVYRSHEAPADLCTQTQLKERRLKVAKGQQPVAYVRINRPHPGAGDVPLYRPEDAAKMRPLSAQQRRTMEARRTCILCRTVATEPLYERGRSLGQPWLPQHGPVCDACNTRHRDRWQRTCERCGIEVLNPLSAGMCDGCRDARQRGQEVVTRLMRRHCPQCTIQIITREELQAADDADFCGRAYGYPRTCDTCEADRQRRAQQARWADERARWEDLGPVREWARRIVAAPHEYAVIDTETTGLDHDAKVVEISATTAAGDVLLDTLVNPGVPIPQAATGVHGITDDDVRDAPSFGAILPQLTEVLRGRGIIIYNSAYDTGVIAYELDRHHRAHSPTLPGMTLSGTELHPAAVEWMDAQQWERCAMLANAVHQGEWSDYWGGWSWPRLYGGHRALGDCRAVVEVLHDIAAAVDPPTVDTCAVVIDVLSGHDETRADTE